MTTRWWVLRTCWHGTERGWQRGAQPSRARAAAVMAAAPCPATGRPAAAGPAVRRAALQRRRVLLSPRVTGGQQPIHCKSFPAAPRATVPRRRSAPAARLPCSGRRHGHLRCGIRPASQQRRISSRCWQPGRAGLCQGLLLAHLSSTPAAPKSAAAASGLAAAAARVQAGAGQPCTAAPGSSCPGPSGLQQLDEYHARLKRELPASDYSALVRAIRAYK